MEWLISKAEDLIPGNDATIFLSNKPRRGSSSGELLVVNVLEKIESMKQPNNPSFIVREYGAEKTMSIGGGTEVRRPLRRGGI